MVESPPRHRNTVSTEPVFRNRRNRIFERIEIRYLEGSEEYSAILLFVFSNDFERARFLHLRLLVVFSSSIEKNSFVHFFCETVLFFSNRIANKHVREKRESEIERQIKQRCHFEISTLIAIKRSDRIRLF